MKIVGMEVIATAAPLKRPRHAMQKERATTHGLVVLK